MVTYKTLNEQRKRELEKINDTYDNMIMDLQSKCNHIKTDRTTAKETFCDDNDLDGWREPTYEEWTICSICGKEF